jgi:hypothetical protein
MAQFWETDPISNAAQSQAVAADWWSKDPVAEQTAAEKADADVRAGKSPDYFRPSMMGGRFDRLSDQLADPLGIQDEMVGAGQAIREFVTGARAKKTGNPSIWNSAGDAYNEAAEYVRARRRVAREENTIAPEIVGGLATAGAARAAGPAMTWLQSLRPAAQTGAGFGAVTGFAQGEGGVGNRLADAAEGAGVGAVAAPVVSSVVVPGLVRTGRGIRDAARYGANALRSARDPAQAAIETLADRMVAAGVDPAVARARVSPQPSNQLQGRINPNTGQNYSAEDMADIVSRSMRGETDAAIAADHGLHPTTVRNYVNTYRENNPTPMNIMDVAKEVVGEGGSAPITRLGRATYSLAGDESGEAAQRLVGRQDTQAGRVSNIINRSVAGGDFEATRATGLTNLQNEARQAYGQFYAEPDLATNQLGDLMQDPLFRRATVQAQRQARVEAIRRNQNAARTGGAQEPVPTVSEDNEVFSPEMLDHIQRQLRITSEGAVSNPNNARHARNLREVFLDRIEDHYPTFRDIRRNYAQGQDEFGEHGALEAGAQLTTRLGAPSREALRDFHTMTPAQQGLYRLGFARSLMDKAANPQIGGAVANQFNSPAVREIVETLYPATDRQLHQQGQRLLRDLQREAITTRTKNDVMSGARTAELGSDMGRVMEGAKTAADVATGRWGKLLDNLSTRLSTQLGRRGSREVLDLLTQTDPAQLLPTLNRLARAAQTTQERQAYVTAIRDAMSGAIRNLAPVTGIAAGDYAARQ